MGRYLEALTRLFLSGAFPGGGIEGALARPARAIASRTRAQARGAPAPAASAPPRDKGRNAGDVFPDKPRTRRQTRQRKFRVAPSEGQIMTHPGRILARHLSDLGMTASDLARDIDVPVNRVTAIINGQRGVTADTALRLAHWFGVEPEDWLELQLQYELALAREEVGARIRRLPRLVDRVS